MKNTFLTVEQNVWVFGGKRRSLSEDVHGHREEEESRLSEHAQFHHLQLIVLGKSVPFRKHSNKQCLGDDVLVLQTDCHSSCTAPWVGRSLAKIGQQLSICSVSTMAPEDYDDEDDCEEGEYDLTTALKSSKPSIFLNHRMWDDEEDEPCRHDNNATMSMVPKSAMPISVQSSQCSVPAESTHCLVPRRVDLAKEYEQNKKEGQTITTVMIRNLPNRCGQNDLIDALSCVGLAGSFDFLYIPLDLGTNINVGYGFVNFIAPTYAIQCMERLPKHEFQKQRKLGKHVQVLPAHMQGLEANLRHYEKAAVSTSRLRRRRPVILNDVKKPVSLADCL